MQAPTIPRNPRHPRRGPLPASRCDENPRVRPGLTAAPPLPLPGRPGRAGTWLRGGGTPAGASRVHARRWAVAAVLGPGLPARWPATRSPAPACSRSAADLVGAGLQVLVVDLLGFGDSDKPSGTDGYDARAMSEQVRSLAALAAPRSTKYLLVAHDMGAPPALLWAAGHPREVQALMYIEAPVMVGGMLRPMISYTRQAMSGGSMWWWILPLAPGVSEALIAGTKRRFRISGPFREPLASWGRWGSTGRPSPALSRPSRCNARRSRSQSSASAANGGSGSRSVPCCNRSPKTSPRRPWAPPGTSCPRRHPA